MAQRQWRSDDTDAWLEGFGDGSDGSSYSVPANEGCSGTSGTTSVTLATAGAFANDDLVIIHQTRGTGVGTWELNKIVSGGGTTSLTMKYDLMNTYTDSGDSQAQMVTLHQYEGLTVSGTTSAPDWDGSKGGILAFIDKGTTTISGTLDVAGTAATSGTNTVAGATGGGFRGGQGRSGSNNRGTQGESSTALGSVTTAANGAGGGGAYVTDQVSEPGGGSGGHATVGAKGDDSINTGVGGTGGGTDGNASLTDMVFGGAGGGKAHQDASTTEGGASSGGIVLIIAKDIVITGTIDVRGGSHSGSSYGGAAAGGSILLKCETATLGTTKALATGGTHAGTGRIHIDYSKSYTGTTTPTLNSTEDATIISPVGPVSSSFSFSYFM